jgi:hypothetical protein
MKNLLVATAGRVRRCPPVTLISAAVVYEVALGLLDYTTPEEMSFTIFYLLGVAFVGYSVGRRPVLPLAALATGIMAIHERNPAQHDETRMALLL